MKINFEWQNFLSKNNKENNIHTSGAIVENNKNVRKSNAVYNQTIVNISGKEENELYYSGQETMTERLDGITNSDEYLAVQRDFMTIMSNSMSASDFQKMKEEGYDVSSMEPEQVVTILDKIKTALAQAGTYIQGYNDNLSVDKITEITGNSGYAETIARELSYADVPVTEENIQQIDEMVDQILTMEEPGEGSKAYMVSHKMTPTLKNLYKALHSSTNVRTQSRKTGYASNGYGRNGEDAVQIRKTAVSDKDYEQIEKQIKNRIQADGLELNEDTLGYGKWLLEKGIPVTGENIELLQNIENIKFPLNIKQMIKQAAQAIGEGKSPFHVNLNKTSGSVYEEAVKIYHRYHNITFQSVDYVVNNHMKCNLHNMEIYDPKMGYTIPQIEARKTLEEVRLKMTVEANVKLLQSGYSIETASMEDLIKQLDAAAKSINENIFGKTTLDQKAELFSKTHEILGELPRLPIAVVGKIPYMENNTLPNVVQEGNILQKQYEQLKNSYETIMTEPRADLGDSIQKAFRNVDVILKDMDLEINESNRRAIRIMGYNQITITEDNLDKVKKADRQIRTIIEKMKPGMMLKMIREGKNPLEMSMDEMEKYIADQENDFLNDTKKFSEFLFKLDKKKEITEAERNAYIGVYRLFRQIDKSDGAVVGSLLNQNVEISFSNLLSAVRTRKAKHTDIKVDDNLGIVKDVYRNGSSISEQIEKGISVIQKNLNFTQDNRTQEDILKDIWKISEDQSLEKQFLETQLEEIREISDNLDKEKDYLEMYRQPITLDHLQSCMILNQKRGYTFKQAIQYENDLPGREISNKEENILKQAEEFLSNVEKKENRDVSYEKMISHTKQILEQTAELKMKEYLDIKELQSVYKQVSMAQNLSKEENYEIPIQIGEEITSINLKIIHGTEDKGEVRITLETEIWGKVEARFVEIDGGLEGSVLTDYMDKKELLKSHMNDLQKALTEALKETKTEVKSLFFGVNEKLNLNSLEEPKIEKSTDVSLLYKVAKEFIYYLKNIKEA